MSARLAWTTLHIADLDRSLAFYRDIVGMKEVDRYRIEAVNEEIVVLQQDGGGSLELVAVPGFQLRLTDQENISLAIEVDDAMDVISKLGGECLMNIEPSPTVKFFFTKDPDGYSLNLIERH